ncbi:MAG: hypothetical protein E7614_08570 [Ruminococcaceae bacterium]|nr:hypothetical protein [Oscillospiraceae bacterium]
MFLDKKGFRKILIWAIVTFVEGCFCIGMAMFLAFLGRSYKFLLVLGIISYVFTAYSIFFGRYAEGKGKLINLGNDLICDKLQPAEFIKEYEALMKSDDFVIKKPSVEVLRLAALAYYVLDDKEKVLSTVDKIIEIEKENKKPYFKLVKSSYLFCYGEKEEAEKLFIESQKGKLDVMSKALADDILKNDRAFVMGDYSMVEIFNQKLLSRTFPKPNNLSKVIANYTLANVYEKTQEKEKYIECIRYCVENGGETFIQAWAESQRF